jgi:hypothetical protein
MQRDHCFVTGANGGLVAKRGLVLHSHMACSSKGQAEIQSSCLAIHEDPCSSPCPFFGRMRDGRVGGRRRGRPQSRYFLQCRQCRSRGSQVTDSDSESPVTKNAFRKSFVIVACTRVHIRAMASSDDGTLFACIESAIYAFKLPDSLSSSG